MRIDESADGTLKVVELDPTKRYWFIVSAADHDLCAALQHTKRNGEIMDGVILRKRPETVFTIVESPEGLTPLTGEADSGL